MSHLGYLNRMGVTCSIRKPCKQGSAMILWSTRPGPKPSLRHYLLDNLSAHKTEAVREFLARNPRVHFHFTPTYSSWLNQVELWFAKIQRDVIARGVFTSVADLAHKLMKYIRLYAKSAKPFRWTYTDPSRRIKVME